jgi:hypothetical protein
VIRDLTLTVLFDLHLFPFGGTWETEGGLASLHVLYDWRPDFAQDPITAERALDLRRHGKLVSGELGTAVDTFIE